MRRMAVPGVCALARSAVRGSFQILRVVRITVTP